MNERIKQLAEQATLAVTKPDGHYIVQAWQAKFAELIVKECMTMCDDTRADYFKHRKSADDFQDKNIYAEGEAASDIIKYKIKKHFGVTE
jgi:hypothetical protein